MSESLNAVMSSGAPIAGTAIGLIFTWFLGNRTQNNEHSKWLIRDFATEVLALRRELILFSESIDQGLAEWRQESVRRLDRRAGAIATVHFGLWKRVEPVLEAYKQDSHPDDFLMTRRWLLGRLDAMLIAVREYARG